METPKTVFELIKQLKSENKSDAEINRAVNYFLEDKARQSHTPRHGHFELTPLCNLDCKMCYVHLNKDQMQGQQLLSVETWKDLMQQAIDAGMTKASLSGGECLTYPGFDELYLFLRSKGIEVNVLTNGILLNKERIEFFKKHRPNLIQVTLYGSNNETYEKVTGHKMFDIVFNNIMAAKKAELPIRISITPSKYILNDIKNMIKLLQSCEISYVINTCLSIPRNGTGREENRDDINVDDYISILKYDYLIRGNSLTVSDEILEENEDNIEFEENGLACGAGKSGFSITWQGKMLPCTEIITISSLPLKIGFKKAWENVTIQCSNYPKFVKCNKCKYRSACVYCAGRNERLSSRFELSPMWCERAKKMVSNGICRIQLNNCD